MKGREFPTGSFNEVNRKVFVGHGVVRVLPSNWLEIKVLETGQDN